MIKLSEKGEKMSTMTTAEYNKMCEQADKAAEAFMKQQKKEYPNMPEDVEEVCNNCREMGKGCDVFPCDACYESWK